MDETFEVGWRLFQDQESGRCCLGTGRRGHLRRKSLGGQNTGMAV